MNKKTLIDLIGLLLIALVVVVGYKLSPMLAARADLTLPTAACDLQRQDCRVDLPRGGQLELRVGTRPIPLVRPFAVTARLHGRVASRVEVDFAGVDMSMGLNRIALNEAAPGEFVGEATLPICVTGQMAWQASVLIDTAEARLAVPFRFITGAH